MIRIYCDAAHAVLKETEVLTSGMTNYPHVLLTFSEDWDGMGKVAVCRAGPSTEQSVDVEGLVTYALGSTFVVPSECLAQSGVELYIGIQGVNAQAEVAIPTIWVSAGTIMEGVDIDEATNTGTATPTLVQQMIAYAGQMEEAADDLAQNVIRTVEVNDTYANRFGEVDVQLTDTGAGENRKLTFTFSNMKGNGIESIAFVQTGTNTGRVVVTESNGNVTNYDGIKDALDYVYNYIDQNVSTIITEYIELHPEYVTTVMDGSVSYEKLDTQLQGLADIVEQIDDIPTRTSDLINDSNFPEDADYVHTDNNYTDADEAKLAGIEAGANAYTHPTQTSRTGVPTADVSPGFGGTFQVNQIRNDTSGHVTAITARTITMPSADASTSAHGLMSAADKTKLNGIAAGAQVNTVTGVKGSAESSYRTGNINLSAENIGYDDGLSGHTSGSVGAELASLSGSLNSLNNKLVFPNTIRTLGSDDDLNNLNQNYHSGFYFITTGVTNAPETWCRLIVIGGSGCSQIVLCTDHIYVRMQTGNPLNWTGWQRIPESNRIISPSAAFSIPANGSPVTQTLTGVTANHVLVSWGFSSSADNAPPCDLSWSTAANSFTITNNTSGTAPSETIKPVFAIPNYA